MMNVKATRLENLPPEAWTIVTGGDDEGASIDKLYSTIAWLYRATTIRVNGVQSMPFDLRTSSGEVLASYDGSTYEEMVPDKMR